MKLGVFNPPHIRTRETSKTIMDDVLLVLLALYLMAVYYYGVRAVALLLFSAAVGLVSDLVCKPLIGQHISMRERSSVVTSLLIPLMLPASISYTVVAVAVVFAIVVVKYPFGGVGHNLFNPAAGGFAFIAICFPIQVFSYPPPLQKLGVLGEYTGKLVYSAAYTLKAGGVPASTGFLDIALGNTPGPMGAANVLVVLTCLLYLAMRGTIRVAMPLSFLSAAAAFAWFFPRAPIAPGSSVIYELCSGSLIFAAVFMITDPTTSPKRTGAAALYAAAAGVVTMLFRRYGGFEEPVAFAIILCNTIVPEFDYLNELIMRLIRRRAVVSLQNKKA